MKLSNCFIWTKSLRVSWKGTTLSPVIGGSGNLVTIAQKIGNAFRSLVSTVGTEESYVKFFEYCTDKNGQVLSHRGFIDK